MLEVEQWVIQNNQGFFLKELKELSDKSRSPATLDQTIEQLQQAELELLSILESHQAETEEETC